MADDAAARLQLDRQVLALIRTGDAGAAHALCALCLGFSDAQTEDEPRIFWQACAAYFEAIALGLCPMTATSKRTVGQILLQYRAIGRGDMAGLKPVLQEVLFYCSQAAPRQADEAPTLSAIRARYDLGQTVVLPAPDQFKVIGDLQIGIAQFNIFLNEADEWSRYLLTELGEWSLELERPVFDTTLVWAHSLSISARDAGFTALADLAGALERALQHLHSHAPCDAAHAQVFVESAEELRRLLHQFAAGFLKTPDARLMAALQAIAQTTLPLTSPGGAKTFQKEATALIAQLGGALRQWMARPENLGARDEVRRVLQALMIAARQADAASLQAQAAAMVLALDQLASDVLQPAQMPPLLTHFDALLAAIDTVGRPAG